MLGVEPNMLTKKLTSSRAGSFSGGHDVFAVVAAIVHEAFASFFSRLQQMGHRERDCACLCRRLLLCCLWFRQRANGIAIKGSEFLGPQAYNGSEWFGEWLRRLFGGS